MENRKTNFMKRVAMFVIAMAVVLTTVLIPVPAKAAAKDAFVVKSYTMAKGEKWTLNVYNAADNAKISYKSSKTSVATVSKKGVVTAKKAGSATITVTVKEGKGTYKAKTKIKVKKQITYAEAIKRVNAELNLLYVCAAELAEMNGWLENEEAVTYLAACADLVEEANAMAKNPDAYTVEDIEDELNAIAIMAEQMEGFLPVFAEPCE
ncbi:MAG: Ig-like domain-containing protein [Lachnospiraceae bacterium]|nr:Ig-like domain-containing protein [Lachnospiraceae bacterium]